MRCMKKTHLFMHMAAALSEAGRTSLGIATSMSIVVCVGKGARHGVLIGDAERPFCSCCRGMRFQLGQAPGTSLQPHHLVWLRESTPRI